MWDLLIIGAGPAGCAAAISARRHGLTVMMLEASAQPRRAPGETLHPGIEPLFARLDVAEPVARAGFHRHAGIRIGWDAPARFEPYGEDASGPWHGFQADRAAAGYHPPAGCSQGRSEHPQARSRNFARHDRRPAQWCRDRRRRGASGPFDHRRDRSTCLARTRPGNRSGSALAAAVRNLRLDEPGGSDRLQRAGIGHPRRRMALGCAGRRRRARMGHIARWRVPEWRPPGCRRQLAYASANGRTRTSWGMPR